MFRQTGYSDQPQYYSSCVGLQGVVFLGNSLVSRLNAVTEIFQIWSQIIWIIANFSVNKANFFQLNCLSKICVKILSDFVILKETLKRIVASFPPTHPPFPWYIVYFFRSTIKRICFASNLTLLLKYFKVYSSFKKISLFLEKHWRLNKHPPFCGKR